MSKMEFEYECGEFKTDADDKIEFVCVVDAHQMLQKTANKLRDAGLLQPATSISDDTLWANFSADGEG